MIFLTHNDRLHEVNLAWHLEAEELLWVPCPRLDHDAHSGLVNPLSIPDRRPRPVQSRRATGHGS